MNTKPIRYLDVARQEYEAEIDYLITNGMGDRALRFQAEIDKPEKDIRKKPSGYGFIEGYRSYGPTKKRSIASITLRPTKKLLSLPCTIPAWPIPIIGSDDDASSRLV